MSRYLVIVVLQLLVLEEALIPVKAEFDWLQATPEAQRMNPGLSSGRGNMLGLLGKALKDPPSEPQKPKNYAGYPYGQKNGWSYGQQSGSSARDNFSNTPMPVTTPPSTPDEVGFSETKTGPDQDELDRKNEKMKDDQLICGPDLNAVGTTRPIDLKQTHADPDGTHAAALRSAATGATETVGNNDGNGSVNRGDSASSVDGNTSVSSDNGLNSTGSKRVSEEQEGPNTETSTPSSIIIKQDVPQSYSDYKTASVGSNQEPVAIPLSTDIGTMKQQEMRLTTLPSFDTTIHTDEMTNQNAGGQTMNEAHMEETTSTKKPTDSKASDNSLRVIGNMKPITLQSNAEVNGNINAFTRVSTFSPDSASGSARTVGASTVLYGACDFGGRKIFKESPNREKSSGTTNSAEIGGQAGGHPMVGTSDNGTDQPSSENFGGRSVGSTDSGLVDSAAVKRFYRMKMKRRRRPNTWGFGSSAIYVPPLDETDAWYNSANSSHLWSSQHGWSLFVPKSRLLRNTGSQSNTGKICDWGIKNLKPSSFVPDRSQIRKSVRAGHQIHYANIHLAKWQLPNPKEVIRTAVRNSVKGSQCVRLITGQTRSFMPNISLKCPESNANSSGTPFNLK